MLPLDSPRWAELTHAYGTAEHIPMLLRELESFPESDGKAEPWFTIWSALAHQGDVYTASFAAVPHVVQALAGDPARAGSAYFGFPAWVEICRSKADMRVPEDLEGRIAPRSPAYPASSRRPLCRSGPTTCCARPSRPSPWRWDISTWPTRWAC